MKRKTKKILFSIMAVPVGLIAIPTTLILLLWFVLGAGEIVALFKPNPPEPVIRYGEFPFEVVYRLKDETHTVQGVLVSEYDGVGLGVSWPNQYVPDKELKWNEYIKGTEESDLLLFEHEDGKVYCDVGSAVYYLGKADKKFAPTAKLYDKLHDVYDYNNKAHTDEEFKEKYGLEIISYKFSTPIKNTFK